MKKFSVVVSVVGFWLILMGAAGAQDQAQTLGIGGNGDSRVRVAIGKIANEKGFQVIPPWDDYRKARYIVHIHSFEVHSERMQMAAALPSTGNGNNRWYSYGYDVMRGQLDRVTSKARVQLEGFGPAGWYLSSGYQTPGRVLTSQGYTVGSYTANGSYSQQEQVETEAIERAVRNALADLPGPVAFAAPPPPQAESAPVQIKVAVAQPANNYSYVAASSTTVPPITVIVNPKNRMGVKVYGPAGSRFWVKRWNLTRTETRGGVYTVGQSGCFYLRVAGPYLVNIGACAADGQQVPARKENSGLFVRPGNDPDF